MSIEAWVAVLHAEIPDVSKKAVLMGLANHAGPDGRHAYPSVLRLSVYTGLAERSVTRILASLVEEKQEGEDGLVFITREGGGRGHPTEYALNMKRLAQMRDPRLKTLDVAVSPRKERVTQSQGSDPQPLESDAERVTLTPERVTLTTGNPDTESPEPYLTSHKPGVVRDIFPNDQTPWCQALTILKHQLNRGDYATWVEPTVLVRAENGKVVIGGANEYGVQWLREHVSINVADALEKVLGRKVSVEFIVHVP